MTQSSHVMILFLHHPSEHIASHQRTSSLQGSSLTRQPNDIKDRRKSAFISRSLICSIQRGPVLTKTEHQFTVRTDKVSQRRHITVREHGSRMDISYLILLLIWYISWVQVVISPAPLKLGAPHVSNAGHTDIRYL